MEGYLVIFLIIVGLVLGTSTYKEHLTQQTRRIIEERMRPPTQRVNTPGIVSTTIIPTAPDGLRKAIQIYRDNYVAYSVTGKEEHKAAYQAAQARIERFIQDAETKIDKDAKYVDRFVKQYADANRDLTRYKNIAEDIKRQGPEVEGQYMVEKKLNEPEELDMRPLYVKLGVAVLIAGVGVVALFLR
jgi:hypothetical protein